MIIVNLDVMLAKRKMKSNELADKIGTPQPTSPSSNRQGQSHPLHYPLKLSAKNSTANQEIS